ncbi:MAG: DUF3795 domain-containing protein [Longicatena sp.]
MKPNQDTAAICGLFCGTCPCYPTSCHGCLSDHVRGDCETCNNGFRTCAKHHRVTRCSECADMPCERLLNFKKCHYQNGIGHHEEVIHDLTLMKSIGIDAWVHQKTIEHTCPHCGKLIYWYDKNKHTCK